MLQTYTSMGFKNIVGPAPDQLPCTAGILAFLSLLTPLLPQLPPCGLLLLMLLRLKGHLPLPADDVNVAFGASDPWLCVTDCSRVRVCVCVLIVCCACCCCCLRLFSVSLLLSLLHLLSLLVLEALLSR